MMVPPCKPYYLSESQGIQWPRLPLTARSFLRQGRGESDPACNPSMECGLRPVSRRRHEEPACHGTGPGQVERFRARFFQHRLGRRGLDPHNEIVAVNADAHVAAEEEGDPAEHFLLGDLFATCKRLAESRGLGLRIRHALREGKRPRVQKPCPARAARRSLQPGYPGT